MGKPVVRRSADEGHTASSHYPFQSDGDATPLADEEKNGLIPSWITYRNELNEVEEANIIDGALWAKRSKDDILSSTFMCELHKRMFGDVWSWAGKFRVTARNIGIDSWQISTELYKLVDDVRYWIEHSVYEPDEIAARFHHRLVWIHPFPNGNGRHSRLMADLLVRKLGRPEFTWGKASITQMGDVRAAYIEALRAADKHDMTLLLAFIRS